MNEKIMQEAHRRCISRLCHFTPSRNLVHIASGETGILATKKLHKDERSIFTPTDLLRLDGHEEFISCSVEYPNAWYFDKAKITDALFKDWVVLLIAPQYLWSDGTLFCPRNASASRGAGILEGERGFEALFADSVRGAYDKVFVRTASRLACCPTDEQAEILIPDRIPLDDIIGVVVPTESQAKNEVARFRQLGVPADKFPFFVGPTLFDKRQLSKLIQSGDRPVETPWTPGDLYEG